MSAIAARDGIRQLISDNPIMLTVTRMAVVDNLLGQEKAVGEFAEAGRYCCRISRDPGRLQHPQSSPVGLKAASDFYVIAPWHADIRMNDVLREDGGAQWRVGIVSTSKMSGQAFAVKAPLERVK